MAKFSTGLRDAMLGSSSFRNAFYGVSIRVFDGPVPSDADAAETGTLLFTITNSDSPEDGLQFGAPENGAISKASGAEWATPETVAAGTMTYFRLCSLDDDGLASTTAPRIQGTVGLVGTDMIVVSTLVDEGAPWTLNYFIVALPDAV